MHPLLLMTVLALGFPPTPQDAEDRIRELGSAEAQTRNRAGEALVRLWENDAVKKRLEEVARASADADLTLRLKSILGWMEFRKKLGKPVVEAIGDVEGLFGSGDQKLSAALKTWFDDLKRVRLDDPERRRVLLELVVSRLTTEEGKCRVLAVVEKQLFDVENQTIDDAAPAIWAAGVTPLLKDESAQVRADAMCLLGRAQVKGLEGAFTESLSDSAICCKPFFVQCDKTPGCRNCGGVPVAAIAADALADLGAKSAARKIGELLQHGHPAARRHAAQALGKLGAGEFAGKIADLLDDPDPRSQAAGMRALTQLGAKTTAKRITTLLRSPEGWVRGQALETLAALDAQDQVDGIRALLKDDSVGIRGRTAYVLARLGRKECAGEIATLLRVDLSAMTRHERISLALSVVLALRTLEAKDTARALKQAAVDHSTLLGRFAHPDATPDTPRDKVTLAELVDELLRAWGIDPGSLKD